MLQLSSLICCYSLQNVNIGMESIAVPQKTFYMSPATCFTEALPLGNGSIGAMVYGGISEETVSLNHDTLWSGLPKSIQKEGTYDAFLQARRYVTEGKYAEAHRLLSSDFLSTNSENYLPLGDMQLSFDYVSDATDYRRELNLEDAQVSVFYRQNGYRYTRNSFISYPDDIMVMRLMTDAPSGLSFTLSLRSPLRSQTHAEGAYLMLDGECPGYSHADDPENRQVYEYSDRSDMRGILFRAGVKVIAEGRVTVEDGSIRVENASEAVILFSVKTSFNGYDKLPAVCGRPYKEPLLQTLAAAEALGYGQLLLRHTADYRALYTQVSLDLGKSGRENLPTDERLRLFQTDKNDNSLYTLLFDFGRYLQIASSRSGSEAANLQGIWNESLCPPWRSNYTANINTEMNYFPTLMCGLFDCFQPLVRFMEDRRTAGKVTAAHDYHARGFAMHHNSDIWAHTTAVSKDAQWGFWHGAGGWMSHHLFDYYEYTLDRDYLQNTCFPIMKDAALFYLDLLCDRGDGKWSLVPMTSPENMFFTKDGERSAVAKYTTMSDAIAYELFLNCQKAIAILGGEEAFLQELHTALSHMDPFRIDSRGRLMEWNEEFEETEPLHRHISHLYALHPAHLITPESTPELAEACQKTLDARGDDGTGWSLGWKLNFRARLNDGESALRLLDRQLSYVSGTQNGVGCMGGGTYSNLFDAHPPFQIDGNLGAVSGILEMLVDTRNGALRLLPALPRKWHSGSLRGVRVKGGKILDIVWKDGVLTSVTER